MDLFRSSEIIRNRRFHLEERLTIFMAMLLNLLIILFSNIKHTPIIFLINIGIVILIIAIAYLIRFYFSVSLSAFRNWYPIVLLFAIYMEHQNLIPLINPHDVDDFLIRIDRFIFLGNDPTILMERFTFPLLTEYMQVVYTSFYFLPFALCALLYRKENKMYFHAAASILMFGFYVSFAGYYITPAIGPRFTLEHLHSFPLKGVLLFDFLRSTLAGLEGVTRDCCPSGHTLISLLTLMLARRFYKPFFPVALIWSALQIVSTVYLRYHYATDIIVSIVFVLPVYAIGIRLAGYYLIAAEKERQAGNKVLS